jgi:hypothetical protein
MRGWSSLAGVALLALLATGCKEKRTRRPRTPPPAAKQEEAPAAPPPKEVAEARPAPPPAPPPTPEPPPKKKEKAEDRSTCGPSGQGPRFAVHGVEKDDTLNVRAEPSSQAEVLGQLLPNTTGVVALGEPQKVGPSTWRKVKCGALVGWVNGRFLDRM